MNWKGIDTKQALTFKSDLRNSSFLMGACLATSLIFTWLVFFSSVELNPDWRVSSFGWIFPVLVGVIAILFALMYRIRKAPSAFLAFSLILLFAAVYINNIIGKSALVVIVVSTVFLVIYGLAHLRFGIR